MRSKIGRNRIRIQVIYLGSDPDPVLFFQRLDPDPGYLSSVGCMCLFLTVGFRSDFFSNFRVPFFYRRSNPDLYFSFEGRMSIRFFLQTSDPDPYKIQPDPHPYFPPSWWRRGREGTGTLTST